MRSKIVPVVSTIGSHNAAGMMKTSLPPTLGRGLTAQEACVMGEIR